MSTLSLDLTVGELVAERPGRSRVFEKLGIDYCCGGRKALEEACRDRGLDTRKVLEELQAYDAEPAGDETDWTQASMAALADHIEQTHHVYLRSELPRLAGLTEKVRRVHGERHPELIDVERTFQDLRAELEEHMVKEEQVLFPIIRKLEQSYTPQAFHCGSVNNPIRMMEHEHDNAGRALERLRALTGGYMPPADACGTFRATMEALEVLERDLHVHIHKENNILFPRAARREAELGGQA